MQSGGTREATGRCGGLATLVLLCCLWLAPPAQAIQGPTGCERAPGTAPGLPSVTSGERPGPALLYQPPAQVPELANKPPFAAQPLLVSGTDAIEDGEYLYQDFLYDDHGADTSDDDGLDGPSGDATYPAEDRYAGNAADLVELRIKPQPDAIVYRVTLNTVKSPDAAIVGIGIDRDRSGVLPVAWPGGAGISTPGLDSFISAWGSGGMVYADANGAGVALPDGAVTIDTDSNQMTIRVPRSLLDPGSATWRYVAGVGLHGSGAGWSSPPYNLAFRFDEPQQFLSLGNGQRVAAGLWAEHDQAQALKNGTSGRFAADVDFGALANGGDDRWLHAPGRTQTRIHTSRVDVGEGIQPDGMFGGHLQPYSLRVPADCDPAHPPGLTLAFHGAGGNHNQWAVRSPNFLVQMGDERDSYVLSPLRRSTCCYQQEWDADVFEAWADVADHFALDPDRVLISGFSAGGYDSYRLGADFPDLFGAGFAIDGAAYPDVDSYSPGDQDNYVPMTRNFRWVPMLGWTATGDEVAPYVAALGSLAAFDDLGLRNQLWGFAAAEHNSLTILDQWQAAAGVLGPARVKHDPPRVDFTITPGTWHPKYGLVSDHAYWVSGMRLRDPKLLDSTNAARGYVSAVSRAFGKADATTSAITSSSSGPPAPAAIRGTAWGPAGDVPAENRLDVDLHNIDGITIDGVRARLRADRPLDLHVTSDGPATVKVELPVSGPASASGGGTVSSQGVVVPVGSGTRTVQVRPRRRCMAGRTRLGAHAFGGIRLGRTTAAIGRRVKALPLASNRRRARWCVAGRRGRVTAVYDASSRARLILATRGHITRGLRVRATRRALLAAHPHARRVLPGVYRWRNRLAIVRGARVRSVGVASARALSKKRTLRRYLRTARS